MLPVDCEWEEWSDWQACSLTCGGGEQQRTRGTLGPLYGGAECTGDTQGTQPCNTLHCPGGLLSLLLNLNL